MTDAPVVIILAGGANSRFWPLEHKTLFPFLGEPLLARHIRLLREAGCRDFIVIANTENYVQIRSLLETLPASILEADIVVQQQPLGMADALLCAESLLQGKYANRAIYVTQAHDVTDKKLHTDMLRAYQFGVADGYIPARQVETYFEGGYLILDGQWVTGIIEKPGVGNEPSNVIKLVADVFSNWQPMLQKIKELTSSGGDDIYERALTQLSATQRFKPVNYQGPAYALKHPWHVLDVMDYLLGGDFLSLYIDAEFGGRLDGVHISPGVHVPNDANISGTVYLSEGVELSAGVIIQGPVFLDKSVRLAPRTTIIGPAYLGPSVRMFPGALINGPAYIGGGAKLGNNALVRNSIVGKGSDVGFSTEVARSYVGDHCELHTNYVGDSILADGVHMGSGAVTANLRLDYRTVPVQSVTSQGKAKRIDTHRTKLGIIAGRYSQVGINASIMPGQRIGRDAIVGAAVMLDHDLRDNRFVRLRWTESGTALLEEIDAPLKRSEIMTSHSSA